MRKSLFAVALCCMSMSSLGAWAQDDLKSIVTVTQEGLNTTNLYAEDRTYISYNMYQGEGLHTGMITCNVKLEVDNEKDIEVKEPANPVIEVSLSDPYGRIPFLKGDSSVIIAMVGDLKFTDTYGIKVGFSKDVMRGGQYVYRNYIPCIDYLYEETVEIKDEPTVRMKFGDVKVGNDIEVKAVYNTGYPYDPSQFTGNEKATMRLYALGKDDQGNATETEMMMSQKTLRLYRPDQPLVAAIDALHLTLYDPEPGEYRLKMSSDWTHKNANRDDILIVVKDTLRASVRMAKQNYVAGTDKSVKLHMKMNYGYPYVQVVEPDKNPTVRIKTLVLVPSEVDGVEKTDTLVNMTTPIEDAAWADHPLNWEGDIETPALETQEGAPLAETRMVAEVSVIFNDGEQFKTSVPFAFVPQSTPTAIRSLLDAGSSDETWYDLQGRPVTPSTAHGVYIHNHQKVVVK